MGEEIQFESGIRRKDFDRDVVEFYAVRDGKRMRFHISREALEALTAQPIPSGRLVDRFDDLEHRIQEIARRKADALGGYDGGVILIRDLDI